ncbi:MAG: type II secretion system F family protein [Candidatus Acidiferrales bacterium]
MLWAVTAVTFLATVTVLAALLYALSPSGIGIGKRLSRLIQPPPQPQRETSFADKQKERVRNSLAAVGSLVSSTPAPVGSKAQLPMVRAGYRSGRALMAMDGLKILMPVAFVGLAFTTGIYHLQPIFVPLLAAIIGYLLPELWLMWRIQARQHRLRLALPDALDMLVICVEAGLGLDQALIRVAHELRITHPQLSEELQLVNMEMRVGKTRLEAMRELARRTGVEDIKALVAMLIQTERFGTSIAQSLRVHSDDLRVKRRQRAEEMSAKTTVKMVPPLVFFIFPALMVVILGPAVITLMRQFLPALNR